MDEDELSALTVVKLKARLKELGLRTSGKKAELIARLLESETEDEEVVLILDDDEDDSAYVSEFDIDEVLEAEVFEAVLLEEGDLESDVEETVPSSTRIRSGHRMPSKAWYKDGTTIATLLDILLLAGALCFQLR